MSRLVRIELRPYGPRVYGPRGGRWHHGRVGMLLAIAGAAAHKWTLALVGLALSAHDHRDFPWRGV